MKNSKFWTPNLKKPMYMLLALISSGPAIAQDFYTPNSGTPAPLYQDHATSLMGIGTARPTSDLTIYTSHFNPGPGSVPMDQATAGLDIQNISPTGYDNGQCNLTSFYIHRVGHCSYPYDRDQYGNDFDGVDFIVTGIGATGIGTGTPAAKLHINVPDGSNDVLLATGPYGNPKGSNPYMIVNYEGTTGIGCWGQWGNAGGEQIAQLTVMASQTSWPLWVSVQGDPFKPTPNLVVNDKGLVGINTGSPTYQLDVNGNTRVTGNEYVTGIVQIGLQKPVTSPYNDYALSVDGNIAAKKVMVEISDWNDKVFEKTYSLPTLEQVEAYIKTQKRLPDVPSECEVIQNGISLGDMNATLLKKIEELTLYVIQQQKEIDALKIKK